MKSIVQLELTNHCNRRCSYCGQSNMTRAKGFMASGTIECCIELLDRLNQHTVGLNHYGESLIHPEFLDIVARFNARGINPWIYTNGDFLPYCVERLAKLKLDLLVISGHAPEATRRALAQRCLALGLPAQWQVTVANYCLDIAGQVSIPGYKPQPPLKDPATHCKFLRDEMVVVLWNGDLVPCCFDYDGKAVFGNVSGPIDDVLKLAAKPGALCAGCSGHPSNIV